MATKLQDPDFKKFNGYQTADGVYHPTRAAAKAHAQELKIKEALQAAFGSITDALQGTDGIEDDDRGNAVIFVENIPAFLFANREKILAALTAKVNTRKTKVAAPKARKARAAKVAPVVDNERLVGEALVSVSAEPDQVAVHAMAMAQ